jgi:hypothetical protein
MASMRTLPPTIMVMMTMTMSGHLHTQIRHSCHRGKKDGRKTRKQSKRQSKGSPCSRTLRLRVLKTDGWQARVKE